MKAFFDIESTGLDPVRDEILQLSIINENEEVLFSDYIRPVRHKTWNEAEKINHISPEMVKDKQTFESRKQEIQKIFDQATELIAYNANFDISFLKAVGIVLPDVPISDPMIDFSFVYREYSEKYGTFKSQKLVVAARYYGYEFDAHDSLEDIKATKFVYDKMKEKSQK